MQNLERAKRLAICFLCDSMSTESASDAAKRDIEHIMLSQDCEQILKVLMGSESWESQTLDSFFVEIDFLILEIFSQVH